ncbi:P-loop ATPase, Sll1717 family [Ancylobacter amanitiformis]|uniref:Energy-coupling factor transporter ATP-binding protein EcfA2 n=1 Tax=Ancylobacter amanitiformis TaxID=217069 RepID=A0ABU0LLZ0_9HYPH|nr:hypothetical protein [Ancylobacter amanitiformis]MDQ0509719.1 energy-coupling factor transporter ATP-binding protein EcfA2 [Ancylobacter amanitiformis]
MKLLREIDFGEPDANAEYFSSLRANRAPLYIRAWSEPEVSNYDAFSSGQKFILTGQKGTGKTAILRHMESVSKEKGYLTEFIVFKNEIMREAELLKFDNKSITGSIISEEELKNNKFYYHSIKRIMTSIIISKLKIDRKSNESEGQEKFIDKFIGKSGKEAIRLAFDSIVNIIESAEIDFNKLKNIPVKIDPGQLVKKANDDFLNSAVRIAKETSAKVRIFFDEMHFAFRDKDSLKSDAALVRDTVLAAQALNERFAEERIDIVILISLRREFLEQPEIAQADIVHVVESYGETITWENHPATERHPIFEFITLRFKEALGKKFNRNELLQTYLKEIDPVDFLEYTWSKPRDIVRFFKIAQSIDGNTISINPQKYKIILRRYCTQAWQEAKSALAAFIPIDAIPLLEAGLKEIAPGQFDGSIRIDKSSFQKVMKTAYESSKEAGVRYSIDDFCGILYMIGIFYYTYTDANGKQIYQQYHRGNTNPTQSGEIRIHSAIAKALS